MLARRGNIILNLLQASDYDVERAQKGIIYIEKSIKSREVRFTNHYPRCFGEGLQQALLKIIEGTIASVPPKVDASIPSMNF